MENNVVTLNTANKLKAAGFEQKMNIAAWIIWPEQTMLVLWSTDDINDKHFPGTELVAAAPTAQEIVDQLDEAEIRLWRGRYTAWCRSPLSFNPIEAPTMAEALAQLWLKLHDSRQLSQGEAK